MQAGKNLGARFRRVSSGYIFRAYYLERQRNARQQHQQGIDRGSVCESRGPQKPRRYHVVEQVGHSHQP